MELLNESDFSLEKDFFTNGFSLSPLQLGSGTMLVLQECGLTEGQLTSRGVKNLKCLRDILRYQSMEASFGYYSLKYPVRAQVLILSHKPSLLSCESIVTVRCMSHSDGSGEDSMEETLGVPKSSVDDETWTAVRAWWARCMLIDDVSMHESMFSVAEDAFVDMRQQAAEECKEGGALTVDDFQRMLTTTRLCAVADCCREITISHWEKMLRIEGERAARNDSCQ